MEVFKLTMPMEAEYWIHIIAENRGIENQVQQLFFFINSKWIIQIYYFSKRMWKLAYGGKYKKCNKLQKKTNITTSINKLLQ